MIINCDLFEKENVMKLRYPAVCVTFLAIGSGVGLLSSPAAAMAALEVKQHGPVSFVSGGVGEEERQEIEKLSPGYSLELLFATKGSPNQYYQ